MKRGRNQRRRPSGGSNPNRALDSNGPEVRIRGTANQIYDKYVTLARDAASSGDRIKAESYLQHAEHYFRILRAAQQNQQNQQAQQQGQQGQQQGQNHNQQNQKPQAGLSDAEQPRVEARGEEDVTEKKAPGRQARTPRKSSKQEKVETKAVEETVTDQPVVEVDAKEELAPEPEKKPRRRRTKRVAKTTDDAAKAESKEEAPAAAE